MRRIVMSLAVIGVLALGACSGGGSVLGLSGGNSSTERVIVTPQSPLNIARVLPGASLPLSATSVRADQNGVTGPQRFRWSAALTTGQSYPFNTVGQTKPCANVTFLPAGPPGVAAFPYTADFSLYITIDPTNEANILFTPPTIIPNPNPIPPSGPVPPGAGTLTTNFPYCVVVTATPVGGSAANAGSIIVAVVSPTNPEQ